MVTRAFPNQQIVGGATTGRSAALRRTVETVDAIKARIRNGPSRIVGFTKDGISRMAAAEAEGHAYAGARRKK